MRDFRRTLVGVGAALVALSASTAAVAGGWVVELEGTAPVSCHADLKRQVIPASGGVVDLGPLKEACNGVNGFQIYASTPAGGGGAFVVDGRTIPVSASGRTELDVTDGPVMTTRQLSYDPEGGKSPERVTISIVINW
jgi:hypothetical protein